MLRDMGTFWLDWNRQPVSPKEPTDARAP
jgi:hypothetical protein